MPLAETCGCWRSAQELGKARLNGRSRISMSLHTTAELLGVKFEAASRPLVEII